MELQKIIGENIGRFRERMGLTQDDLAQYLDIKRENISYYENGMRNIPVSKLNLLADLFGVSLNELMEKDSSFNIVNVAFAFRAESLKPEDLKPVASFKKVVKNYIKLIGLERKHAS